MSAVAEPSRIRSSDDIARTYDRIAFLYDLYDAPMNAFGGRTRRRRVISRAQGSVLEVGIGTGANLDLYPADVELIGVDISAKMLAKARGRAARMGRPVALREADVERLPFHDASFDIVVANCVFCSVGDPLRGLVEARRVVKPSGQVLLLEHVRPDGLAGRIADLVTPLTRKLIGPELNRRTEETVARSGLRIHDVRREGIWREIIATRD